MNRPEDADAPLETMWEGRFVAVRRRGRWEYAGRSRGIRAVVIIAEVDGELLLVEQYRVPLGKPCLELPAGLIGDQGEDESIESAAIRELEEETGWRAGRIEPLGDFYASPGMLSESFSLVRAGDLVRVGEGGGVDGEGITVHRVSRADLPAFMADKRTEGVAMDVKLLGLLNL